MYPENSVQAEMITVTAMKSGFTGGVVVDFPHSSKARKHYLVLLTASSGGLAQLPQAIEDDALDHVRVSERKGRKGKRGKHGHGGHVGSKRHPQAKGRDWIVKKKELRRKRGYLDVAPDTKYTGRKRRNMSRF